MCATVKRMDLWCKPDSLFLCFLMFVSFILSIKNIYHVYLTVFSYGAVHKGRPHKITKNCSSPLVRKMSLVRTDSTPLSVQTHHKFRKIRCVLSHLKNWRRPSASEEPPSSLSAKCPHWTSFKNSP